MRTLNILIVSLSLAACGSDEVADSADAAGSTDAALACAHSGFAPTAQTAERDDELGVLFYTATLGEAPNIERLTFDFYFPLGASDGPQEILFDGENLRDCHTCMVARRDCESARCRDGRAFLVQAGTASIAAMDTAGGTFEGTLENVVFAEVTIGAPDLETTLVPGGETWCIDSLAFDAQVTPPL